MADIISFRRPTYIAALKHVAASGLQFSMAGTLDGFIDFCITESDGRHATYQITCDDARNLIASIHAVVSDIQKNCLFGADPLLVPEGEAP
jgi:hypothetical protein